MLFANPVRGTIYRSESGSRFYLSQDFGCNPLSLRERPLGNCPHFHRGIDVARSDGGCGADLLAAQAGTVHFAGKLPAGAPSYGAIVVEINHGGGTYTAYTHLQSEIVAKGQTVTKGQKIGAMGKTGNATGCHVHFAVKTGFSGSGSMLGDTDGKWADPWPLLAQNQPTATVHPKPWDGQDINIRATAGAGTTLGPKYAVANQAGHIVRVSDGADQGLTATPRPYGGRVTGASYPAGQGYAAGNTWERIELAGAYRFLATPLAVVTT